MNEQLQQQMTTLAAKWLAKLDAGADLATEEVPKFAQEYVQWVAWESFLTAGLLAAVFAVILAVILKCLRWAKRCWDDDDVGFIFALVLVGPMMICGIEAAKSLKQGVKAVVAPRVVLVEKLSELAKGK